MAAIRAGEAGGVILFTPNIASRAQIRSTVAGLQRASLASPVHTRLLILTDQEGGEVRRLPGAPALSEKQIGASTKPLGQARSAGAGAGANLRRRGVNVNLAPVLDVFRTSGNFIDEFQRSYSRRASTVGRPRRRLHLCPAASRRGRHGQAFPRSGRGGPESEHRPGTGDTARTSLATLRAYR